MTAAKNEVFIGLQHENCYLVGESELLVGGVYWGKLSLVQGWPKFWLVRGIPNSVCQTFKFDILFQFTSDTNTSFMHPTPAKLEENGIIAYTLLQTTKGNLPPTLTFTAFFLLITILLFLTFTLNLFYYNAFLQTTLPFRYSVLHYLMLSYQHKAHLLDILT